MPTTTHGSRYRRAAIAVLVAVALVASATGVVAAQETRAGGSVVVDEGETVDGIQTLGGTVVVRGTVDGDLQALSGSVVIEQSGHVTGDVQATAGSVTVLGTVDGSLEASAGSVSIGESAVIDGDVRLAAGDFRMAGTVNGSVEAGVDNLRLTATAVIAGDLRYSRNADFAREDGATVGGEVTAVRGLSPEVGFGGFSLPDPGPLNVVFGIYWALVTLLLGAILLAAFPRFTSELAGEVSTNPLRAGGVGLVGLIGVPIALVLIAITIVGIPLTVLGFMAWGLAVFVSIPLGEYAVGSWALSHVDIDSRWAALVVGVVGVATLSRIPVVGWVIEFAVFLLGFGALLWVLYRGFRRRHGDDETDSSVPAPDAEGSAATQ